MFQNQNTNRHAFVDFTPKPYIHYHGIPYQKQQLCSQDYDNQNYNNQILSSTMPLGQNDRTIIRTNQPNNTPSPMVVPSNQQFLSQAPVNQQNKIQLKKLSLGTPNTNHLTNAPVIPYNSQQARVPNYDQLDGLNNVMVYQLQFPSNYDDSWSNLVRKDNLFNHYTNNC